MQLVYAWSNQPRLRGRVQPFAYRLGPAVVDVQQVGLEINLAKHGFDGIGWCNVYW